MAFKIESPAFRDGEEIPDRYTCEGEDISPPIKWSDVPKGTKSMVLICDDPDAPMGTWDHWIITNLDPETDGIPESAPATSVLPGGEAHGTNSWGREDYGGPCPPSGKPHRYFFKLYAIDSDLDIPPGLNKYELMERIKVHVLEMTKTIGLYSR